MRITTSFQVGPRKVRRTPDDILSGVLASLDAAGVPVVTAHAKPVQNGVLVSVTTDHSGHAAVTAAALEAVARR